MASQIPKTSLSSSSTSSITTTKSSPSLSNSNQPSTSSSTSSNPIVNRRASSTICDTYTSTTNTLTTGNSTLTTPTSSAATTCNTTPTVSSQLRIRSQTIHNDSTATILTSSGGAHHQYQHQHSLDPSSFLKCSNGSTGNNAGGGNTNSSGSGSSISQQQQHHWNVDDLTYVTHMQRVRARANFARQMSTCYQNINNNFVGSTSTAEMYRRRRESIAAMNFHPIHMTSSGTGLNSLMMLMGSNPTDGTTNLIRIRNSLRGQSAPSLSLSMKEFSSSSSSTCHGAGSTVGVGSGGINCNNSGIISCGSGNLGLGLNATVGTSCGSRRIQRCSTSRKSFIHSSTSPTMPKSPLPQQNRRQPGIPSVYNLQNPEQWARKKILFSY